MKQLNIRSLEKGDGLPAWQRLLCTLALSVVCTYNMSHARSYEQSPKQSLRVAFEVKLLPMICMRDCESRIDRCVTVLSTDRPARRGLFSNCNCCRTVAALVLAGPAILPPSALYPLSIVPALLPLMILL